MYGVKCKEKILTIGSLV
jgi:hypothetical protein